MFSIFVYLLLVLQVAAYSNQCLSTKRKTHLCLEASSKFGGDNNFLMDEYRDQATGEILNPYKILKVSRKADRQEIKAAYRALSRRYHPDMLINRDILPGACNNVEEVRDHWERVKLSYEILSHPVSRKRYDRHEMISDPGKAMQRAASQAALDAAFSVGKGVWVLGSSVIKGAAEAVATSAKKGPTNDNDAKTSIQQNPEETNRYIDDDNNNGREIDPRNIRQHLDIDIRSPFVNKLKLSRVASEVAFLSKSDKKGFHFRTSPSFSMSSKQ